MKKTSKQIIGLLTAIVLTTSANLPSAQAQSVPEIACNEQKQEFEKAIEETKLTGTPSTNEYKGAFETVQVAYHDYVGCMFEYAKGIILQSDGTDASDTGSASTPNAQALAQGIPVAGKLIDWMSPDQACLDITEFKLLMVASEPSELLTSMLDTFNTYKQHLRSLGQKFDSNSTITDQGGEELRGLEAMIAKDAFLGTISRQRELEINSSRLAIDLMFTSLKELRLAFVMHVNFQCTLKFLDKYRLALEEMRKVIDSYPVKLENASTNP